MNALDLEFPDFSSHPAAPRMTFAEYQRWICEEIVPELARRGEMTLEKLHDDFMNNEGRMKEFRYDG